MFIAPMLIGGRDSKGAVEAQGAELIADAIRRRVHRGRADRLRRADHCPAEGVVMFTGLVQTTAPSSLDRPAGCGCETAGPPGLSEGDSVAVNGVCLTAAAVAADGVDADVMAETLRRTALGGARAPEPRSTSSCRCERATALGGHIVQGHVDGIGAVEAVDRRGLRARRAHRGAGRSLRYVVEKGSVAVDGVSLTVAEVDDDGFSVSLIPRRWSARRSARSSPAGQVNVEVDVIAKYVEKLMPRGGARHERLALQLRSRRRSRTSAPARWWWSATPRTARTRATSPWRPQFATPEAINFMATHGRGLICLALTPERCDELGLDLMAAKNESPVRDGLHGLDRGPRGHHDRHLGPRPRPHDPGGDRPAASAPATSSSPATSSR